MYADHIAKVAVLIGASLQTRERVLRFEHVSRDDQVRAPLPALCLAWRCQAWPVLPHDDEFVDIFAWREIVEEKLFTNAS